MNDQLFIVNPVVSHLKDYLPLWDAMLGGQPVIVEIFIGLGADPDKKCSTKKFKGFTFLQYAAKCCFSQKNFKIAEVLVRHGAEMNVSHTQKVGDPLWLAIVGGNFKLTELLLKNGAKIDKSDSEGGSFWDAIFFINDDSVCKKMMLLLVKYSLDPGYINEEGKNILQMFLDEKDMRKGGGVEVVEQILNYGVPVNVVDEDGNSPLHQILTPSREEPFNKSDVKLASLLLKKGANVNLKSCSYQGIYPLSEAVRLGDDELVDLFLSYGAELEARDEKFGFTALHYACICRNKPIMELLLRKGANVKAKDKKGRTPMMALFKLGTINDLRF